AVSVSNYVRALLASSALLYVAAPALAQTEPQDAAASPQGDDIIVTATRQGDTLLSRVPMSITAKTQESLDQAGIKAPSDLSRLVPALRMDDIGPASSNISIRGVRSEVGSATTGVYVDDTALQARS